jgi:Universal stress protein family
MSAAQDQVSEHMLGEAPARPRTVVVGLDGSASAGRALTRAASLVDEDGVLVLVAVAAELQSPGILAAPLLDTRDGDVARLLGAARERVPPDAAACVVVARRGEPAEVLAEVRASSVRISWSSGVAGATSRRACCSDRSRAGSSPMRRATSWS